MEAQQLAVKQTGPQVPLNSGLETQVPQNASVNQQQQAVAATTQSWLAQFSGLIASGANVDYGQVVAMAMALQSQSAGQLVVPMETPSTGDVTSMCYTGQTQGVFVVVVVVGCESCTVE